MVRQNAKSILNTSIVDFCYNIYLSTGQHIYLTSAATSHNINCNSVIYLPNSSLELENMIVDDSGNVTAKINGVFEEGGIHNNHILTDAKIEILTTLNCQDYDQFLTLYCNKLEHNNIKFCLYMVSEIVKFNGPILKAYSPNCRAEFGNKACGIDIKKYTKSYNVKSINLNKILVEKCSSQTSNYIHGMLEIGSSNNIPGKYRFNVINHYDIAVNSNDHHAAIDNTNSVLEINMLIPRFLYDAKTVTLTLGCDKTFLSCCRIFNNAINFRGEPFISNLKNFT